MKIITRKQRAKQAVRRWKQTYFRNGEWLNCTGSSETIYNNLLMLGNNPEISRVNEIIGNDSWTTLMCNECGKQVSMIIQVGKSENYENNTAFICKKCLIKAYKTMSC